MNCEQDMQFMGFALDEARKAWGQTTPNPMVGAVVVKDGVVVGRGYHHGAGLPHAEPNALKDAGEQARGATLYVTLEPCCTYGRTPPCTEAVKAAGISRVVIGCLDPNPKHAGRALKILNEAGIETKHDVLADECRKLNKGFFTWITEKRPYVLLKMAMTLDGKIATESGDSKWVTGSDARCCVQQLRRLSDAVMVGGETARLDNPSLLVREPSDWNRQPLRFVWTSRPLDASLSMLQDGGPKPEAVKPCDAASWREFLLELGRREVMFLLLEGGGELAGNALQSGIVDEVAFFIAPKLLCGRGSRVVVGGGNPSSLADALQLQDVHIEQLGCDILYSGTLKRN